MGHVDMVGEVQGEGEDGEAPRPAFALPGVHWNRQYYDNMAFHFWEPHHIGRTRDPGAKIRTEAEATNRLRRLEVVLNHQMELFFRLAPRDFTRRLLVSALGPAHEDSYRVVGREFHRAYAVEGATQPDLLFDGEHSVAAIELKLGTKTSLEQVIKYAALFALMPPARNAYGLLFMGPKGFSGLWREKFQAPADMHRALAGVDKTALPGKLRRHLERDGDVVEAVLAQLKIGFLGYGDFHAALAAEARSSTHHETYQRLLAGMMAELEERGLAQVPVAGVSTGDDNAR